MITYYQDKSFSMDIKTPPASYFLKKAAKLKSGAKTPGRETVGSVTTKQVREIAEAKMKDLNANDIEAAMKIISGSAGSMGIEVKGKHGKLGKRTRAAREHLQARRHVRRRSRRAVKATRPQNSTRRSRLP